MKQGNLKSRVLTGTTELAATSSRRYLLLLPLDVPATVTFGDGDSFELGVDKHLAPDCATTGSVRVVTAGQCLLLSNVD